MFACWECLLGFNSYRGWARGLGGTLACRQLEVKVQGLDLHAQVGYREDWPSWSWGGDQSMYRADLPSGSTERIYRADSESLRACDLEDSSTQEFENLRALEFEKSKYLEVKYLKRIFKKRFSRFSFERWARCQRAPWEVLNGREF